MKTILPSCPSSVAQWGGRRPAEQKLFSLVPGLGCGFGPWREHTGNETQRCFSLTGASGESALWPPDCGRNL